jgi:hypothetical protein
MSLSLLEQWNNCTRSDSDSVAGQWRTRLQALSQDVMLLYLLLPLWNSSFNKDSEIFILE